MPLQHPLLSKSNITATGKRKILKRFQIHFHIAGNEGWFWSREAINRYWHRVEIFLIEYFFLDLKNIENNPAITLNKSTKNHTSCVYTLIGIPKALARPKSASLIVPLSSINRFWGFKSLCRTLLEWQNTIPCRIWYK